MHFQLPKWKYLGKGALPLMQSLELSINAEKKGLNCLCLTYQMKIFLKGPDFPLCNPPKEIVYPYKFRQKGTEIMHC